MYRDGRVVLSRIHWSRLRTFVWYAMEEIYGYAWCHICGRRLWTSYEMELDHFKSPRGLGGGFRDDRFVKPACHECREQARCVYKKSTRGERK
jgi:hypothetical protein